MNYKLLLLPMIVGSLAMTGCANRKPATTDTTSTVPSGSASGTGVSTSTIDPYADIDQRGGSSLGVTDANRPFLAKRVVHFDYDSSDLSQNDYQTLQAHAQYLNANANSKVALIGHTDERGTREYNMALGERRAKSVAAFLVSNGVRDTQLETVSYGKEQPVNDGHDEAAWRENRRVVISYEAVPPLLSVPNNR
ncbi:peptidoglycan-associated lipoprotein Pal [Acinetobacter populi]|uniref:Peptidoglycan-associated lipoprotein n=1 Tax=Acinetobacter populi TaxID=1582270 RepID=A0A1Z9Z441_9GAMM|nr:peptidoglycan-associated lipoprotein Pal [Acinetobacter populi]MCH4246422.1 peptidoglycan-associated lipoprotein Pal [Acinetobacter populi]OUY09210.1 peptidoglycan-associated lipoprotein [Acinetobacter populi]